MCPSPLVRYLLPLLLLFGITAPAALPASDRMSLREEVLIYGVPILAGHPTSAEGLISSPAKLSLVFCWLYLQHKLVGWLQDLFPCTLGGFRYMPSNTCHHVRPYDEPFFVELLQRLGPFNLLMLPINIYIYRHDPEAAYYATGLMLVKIYLRYQANGDSSWMRGISWFERMRRNSLRKSPLPVLRMTETTTGRRG